MSCAISTLAIVVLSVLCASAQGCTDDWDHIIYVDHTATDTPTCGNITHRCSTFNTALNKLTHNSTAICLYPGTYNLTNGSHTQLLYKSNIAIIGSSEDTVTVQCSPLSGLSFCRSSNITLKSLTLQECGGLHVQVSSSIQLDFIMFQVSVYMLYCENVLIDNVTIESSNGTGLTLYNTVGTVTIQYSVFKYNGVLLEKSSIGGGGLQIEFTYMYCHGTPGDISCKESDPYYTSNAQYSIISSVFTGNTAMYTQSVGNDGITLGRGGGIAIISKAHSAKNNIFSLLDTNITNNTAQQGGGIYLALHDGAQNNMVYVYNVNLANNTCNNTAVVTHTCTCVHEKGGNLHIRISGTFATDNNITIVNSLIEHNKALVGGGILVLIYSNSLHIHNNITINNSSLNGNSARYGAAMYVYTYTDNNNPLALSLHIANTDIADNTGIDMQNLMLLSSPLCSGIMCIYKLQFILSDTIKFRNNNDASAIELHNASITLYASTKCTFDNNTGDRGGAIALYNCSTIVLHDNVQLIFNNNSASIGGAIYSGECSLPVCFIQYYQAHVNPEEWNVQLYFSDNIAATYGNATYISNVVSCWPPNVTCSSITENVEIKQTFCWNNTWHYSPGDCYSNVNSSIVYYRSSLPSYSVYPGAKLNLKLEFYDGQIQPSSLKKSQEVLVCINGPASFNDTANDPDSQPMKCNTIMHDISSSLSLYFAPNNITGNCIHNDKSPNITFSVTLPTSIQCTHLATPIKLTFKPCPFGFKHDPFCPLDQYCSSNRHCSCEQKYYSQCFVKEEQSHLTCKDSIVLYPESICSVSLCGIGSTVTSKKGQCLFQYNSSDNSSNIGIGSCPIFFGNESCENVYSNLIALDYQCHFCSDTSFFSPAGYRTGRLCGSCIPGTAVPINDVMFFPCVNYTCSAHAADPDCFTPVLLGWHYVVAIQFIPLTIMVVLIIVLDIKLVGGHITGYILYCQIVSLPFATPISEMSLVIAPIMSMWNLHFLTTLIYLCITITVGGLEAILFWYIVAFYPLVLLLLLYIWIIMYERGWRMVVCITRPVHRLLARFWLKFDIHPSLIDSIAGIYILCFTQLAAISFKLLHFSKWESLTSDETGLAFYYDGSLNYFGWPHALAGSFAIIVLIAFVIIPTVYLLLYPLKLFQKFLDVCRIRRQFTDCLIDSLTGPFKNGSRNTKDYRFFAGICYVLSLYVFTTCHMRYSTRR